MSRMGWERPEDWEEQAQYERDTGLRERLFFIRLLVIGVIGLLLFRIIWLQQVEGTDLTVRAIDNQFAILTSKAPRGIILDREGRPLAQNLASFDVAVVPVFLPEDEAERQAVFERLSMLISIPVTNTIQQRALIEAADPEAVSIARRLAPLYGAPITPTLDLAGIVPELPASIVGVVRENSFAPNLPAVITTGVPITTAMLIQQESTFLPGVRVIPNPIRNYPSGPLTAHIIGFMGPLPDQSYLDRYEPDDRVGLFGLESSLESYLAGQKGERQIEVDWRGREVRQIGVATEPVPGYNLHLTIDLELQEIAYNLLQDMMQLRRETRNLDGQYPEIEQGAVVAMDPRTGEILAMVNLPGFDNNRFATEIPVEYYLGLERNDYQPLLNHAIAGQYPPGSVFKVVTAAAALQDGIISPNRFLDAPGAIVIPNRYAPNDPGRSQQFVCWIWNTFDAEGNRGEHGRMNMYSGLANSCDIYFYKIAGGFDQDGEFVDRLGITRLAHYSHQFGMGELQGIELPAEAPGNIPTESWKRANYGEPWSTGDDYNSAIGQGFVTATPLQIAQMLAVIANGGYLYRPTLVHHMTDADGNIVVLDERGQPIFAHPDANGIPIITDPSGNRLDPADIGINITFDAEGHYIRQPELLKQLEVDREYLEVIAEGLRLVNQPGGTAGYFPWLDEFGITSAGKTGTAEYCDNIAIKRRWCKEGEILPTHAWYVGYAPYEDPEIVVAAFMFNGGEGSEWAGPIVRDLMKAYFQVGEYAPPEPVDPTATPAP